MSGNSEEPTTDDAQPDADQDDSRLQALRSMLASSEARYEVAMRHKRPTMAIGQRLIVARGELIGKQGLILDADFIHYRVQLEMDDLAEPVWLGFNDVASV